MWFFAHVQVGEFLISWIISKDPLTQFWHNTVFARNQNEHNAGKIIGVEVEPAYDFDAKFKCINYVRNETS